jgi:hypothetical protein
MTDRKTGLSWAAAAAASAIALLSAGASFAQNGAFNTDEPGLRGRDQGVLDKARPLIEADKARPRIGGVWLLVPADPAIKTVDGKLPPMTTAAQKLYRQRIADRKAGKTDDPLDTCLPPGTPRSLWSGEPILIAQAPAKVTFYHQYRHLIRHVFLDGPPKLAEPDPTWEGHSAGWWDGEVLKIETIGFNGEQWLDTAGLPQSPDMKVDEALRLLGPDTLEDQVTVTDPQNYSAPWTTRVTFKRLPETTFMPEEECSEKLLEFPLKPYAPSDGGTGHGSR